MLVVQESQREVATGQGSHGVVLAELQAGAEVPGALSGAARQCLLTLAQRLARVQALGDEYARVCFSPEADAQVRALTA